MELREERRKEKRVKKHGWAKKGGHIAPIFVPSTPGSELVKTLRRVAEEEGKEGVRFNIVESGGKTMKRELIRSNPTATRGCKKEDCPCCAEEKGRGGPCQRANVNYEVECMDCHAKYWGETSRSLYTRMLEHINGQNTDGSFIRKHKEERHNGEHVVFEARVTHVNKDCLTRQVREGVLIKNSIVDTMNTKSEWHQPSLFRVQSEVVRE